jgi:hypothetical protein
MVVVASYPTYGSAAWPGRSAIDVAVWCNCGAHEHRGPLSVTLTKPPHKALKAEAGRPGITVSDLIRRIVDEWRKREERRK